MLPAVHYAGGGCSRIDSDEVPVLSSLCASYSSSSNRMLRSHVYDISPCFSHSAFLPHMAGAFRRTFYILLVVASPCTSPRATHRRTTTQHKVSAAAGACAPGFPSSWRPCNLGMRTPRPCICNLQRRRPASFDLRMLRVGCIIHGSCSIHA